MGGREFWLAVALGGSLGVPPLRKSQNSRATPRSHLGIWKPESGRNPVRKPDFRPGSTIAQHRVHSTLCYAIVLPGSSRFRSSLLRACVFDMRPVWRSYLQIAPPGRNLGFRAGYRPASSRESVKIGPPAGRRPAGGLILKLSRLESGRNPARVVAKHKRGYWLRRPAGTEKEPSGPTRKEGREIKQASTGVPECPQLG